ncbi:MAG: chromate transporter [Firmicutes bacterium]|nr:chromate transporter [Bacillota bacterium]MBQ4091863.1 chromate transporter [Bacillota bacterium]MBQ6810932.1 chromate transporter [Bacillota bacterium]
MSVFQIFFAYFKIGCMAFGGGYTMLPLIEKEFVQKHHTITQDALYELFTLSMSLPGLIAVNMAMFLGHKIKGYRGSFAAAFGIMLPSILIITVIATFFHSFSEIPAVQSCFKGLNIAVLVIIAHALWSLLKKGIQDKVTFFIFLGVFFGYIITGFNPVLFTIAGALVGLFFIGRRERNA